MNFKRSLLLGHEPCNIFTPFVEVAKCVVLVPLRLFYQGIIRIDVLLLTLRKGIEWVDAKTLDHIERILLAVVEFVHRWVRDTDRQPGPVPPVEVRLELLLPLATDSANLILAEVAISTSLRASWDPW